MLLESLKREQCVPGPLDLWGPCGTCVQLTRPALGRLPCLRYSLEKASLFREQESPWPTWTKRWNAMKIVDICDWASDELKTVEITQGFGHASYKLQFRRFVPQRGDTLHESWVNDSVERVHGIPPYAMADMREAERELKAYVDRSVAEHLFSLFPRNKSDHFLWDNYLAAFHWAAEAPVSTIRSSRSTHVAVRLPITNTGRKGSDE